MKKLGIIEGFYGPRWTDGNRADLMTFFGGQDFGFYIYAPKEDGLLRKQWRAEWPVEYVTRLRELSAQCRAAGLAFGVGLSPYAYDAAADGAALTEKIRLLNDIGVDVLGLFFDDMYGHDKIAADQVAAIAHARTQTAAKIVFCPSYYSDDPVLDRIFGARPAGYLETLGAEMPGDIDIVWTGPKVISPDMPAPHLQGVTTILQRAPFIWDNLFANDGPKNCKFLKLVPFAGRDAASLRATGLWGINPMNEAQLSKIVMLAAKKTVVDEMPPQAAYESAVRELLSPALAALLLQHTEVFTLQGLDHIAADEKERLEQQFRVHAVEPAAAEIADWLAGKYLVGPECLTD